MDSLCNGMFIFLLFLLLAFSFFFSPSLFSFVLGNPGQYTRSPPAPAPSLSLLPLPAPYTGVFLFWSCRVTCATTVSLNFASSDFNLNKFSINAFFAHRLLNSTNIGLATLEAEAIGVSEVVEIFLRPNLKIL